MLIPRKPEERAVAAERALSSEREKLKIKEETEKIEEIRDFLEKSRWITRPWHMYVSQISSPPKGT